MRTFSLKPDHQKVAAYHASLADFAKLGVKHEIAVRAAFRALLEGGTMLVKNGCARSMREGGVANSSIPRVSRRGALRSAESNTSLD